jgi:hypothetical protein
MTRLAMLATVARGIQVGAPVRSLLILLAVAWVASVIVECTPRIVVELWRDAKQRNLIWRATNVLGFLAIATGEAIRWMGLSRQDRLRWASWESAVVTVGVLLWLGWRVWRDRPRPVATRPLVVDPTPEARAVSEPNLVPDQAPTVSQKLTHR